MDLSHLGVRIDAIIGDLVMKDIVLTRRKHSGRLTAPKKVSLSFLAVIIIGAIVLSLPFSNKKEAASFLDNLFVATSAVCVTGLSPLTVVDQYNLFGQTVLIILVQIGGLGFLTFLYLFLFLARQRITLSRKLVFTEALNQNSLSMLPRLLKTIFIYTVSIETIGLIFFSMFFIPRLGALKGLYYGIWHSISAFCNAGFDLCGSTSLIAYNTNPIINFIVPFEIIMGGLGFIVVLDIHDKYIKEKRRSSSFSWRHLFGSFALHTKIVLMMTVSLVFIGTLLFLIMEFNNPLTIGKMNFVNKLVVSFFQSVTTRTAGFSTVDMYSLNRVTKILMCSLMFIGGSPASTAGGIKTVTFALVLLLMRTTYRGIEETTVFQRRIKKRTLVRAFSIFFLGLMLCIISSSIMLITEPKQDYLNILMEVFSAFGTVGLSASVTPALSIVGKCVDIILMYAGRIGPISLMILFTKRSHDKNTKEFKYPDEDVLVG
ncbi:potassium uptake protein [Catenibacterium sp. co_0103]|nr:potassium uptake protein [Catenibacterium sp. BIOML-A1]RYT44825.1 potassium uptake protein [Catenibacterium sp. co_0103]